MKTSTKVIHWAPRVICILAIIFISMFAADAFASGLTIWQQIGGFLMHLIPSYILIALLIVAWKWEFVGGIIFTIIGVGLSPLLFMFNYQRNHSIWWSLLVIVTITLPFVIVGVLFILSHYKKRREKLTKES